MATNNAINLKSSGIASYDAAGAFTALANPLTVANGGQGNSSLTAYAVLCGGTTTTNPIQSVASVGTAGQALTSNGAGALPTFQTVSASSSTLLYMVTQPGSPADSTTYFLYFGSNVTLSSASGLTGQKILCPVSGTINKCYGALYVATVLGSGESSSIILRLNNSSDTTVTSSLVASAARNSFNHTSLGISVTAGDYLEVKFTTPGWGTNPTGVSIGLSLLIE